MATVTTIPADITNLKKEIDSIKSDVAKKLESSGGTITGDLTVVGGISGELSGNASTATKLKTARKINSVSFDGSKDINLTPEDIDALPITGGTLTGGLRLLARLFQNRRMVCALPMATMDSLSETMVQAHTSC
ncbi:hypothetical protein FSI95_024410 [Escherichia coli]|nr:hypothetical protein [Escherichia coli]